MAEFSWRSRREAAPSAWSSDEPSVAGGTVHHHPLPLSVRVLLVVYGLALGILILAGVISFLQAQSADAKDREQLKKDVIAAIEQDNAERLAADAKQQEGTRRIVCSLIENDLPRSANTIALARQLKCGSTTAPSPAPTPQAAPAPRAPGQRAPVVIVTVKPAPQQRPERSPASSPAPRPSPSPTCRAYNPITGRCILSEPNTKEKP